jgi:hypothetical protein
VPPESQSARQLIVVSSFTPLKNVNTGRVVLLKPDGTPYQTAPFVAAAAQVDTVAMTQAAITGGESPTEAEFNALRTDVVNTRTTLNGLLAKLRTAGTVTP